jgi:pimeloyl-ACP methyl ester carboxylesterase
MRRFAIAVAMLLAGLSPVVLTVRGAAGGSVLASSSGASCANNQLQSVGSGTGRPVLVVHGMSGSPAIFNVGELGGGPSLDTQINTIAGAHVWSFNYHQDSLDWVTNPDIGPALGKTIACLAHATGKPVVVVDHSMGGLATQLAVAQSDPAGGTVAADVAAVVTIGTPFAGSELLSVAQELLKTGAVAGDLSGDGEIVDAAEVLLSACASIGQITDDLNWTNPCGILSVAKTPVGTALEYDSPQIAALPAWPVGLPVYNTAGNITLEIHYGPIKHTFAPIGDLLVTQGSATAHDTVASPGVVGCTETDSGIAKSIAGEKSACYHAKLPSNRTIDGDVIAVIKEALTPGALLPSISVATGELAQLAPGMASWIVKVPAGYEAATWDANGNIDFWKLSVGPWSKVGASRYPDLGPQDPPYDTKVTGALLTGMNDATFIATGAFTGDGTGTAEGYTLDPGKGWGTIAPGPNNTLVPTGAAATDNTTPGNRFRMSFSGGQIETVDQNSDFYVADGSEYGTVTDWKWSGSSFTDAHDNIFTAHSAPAAAWSSAGALPNSACGQSGPTGDSGNQESPPPDGTYQTFPRVNDDSSDPHGVDVTLTQNIPGEGTVCQFNDVSQNTPVTMEVTSSSGATSWVTLPIWVLRDPALFLGSQIGPPIFSSFPSADYTYGQEPLFIPAALNAHSLVISYPAVLTALATVSGGKLTSMAVVAAPGASSGSVPSGNTGNTGATTTQPAPTGSTGNTGTANTGSTGNSGNT